MRFLRLAGTAEAPRLRRAAAFSAFARLRGREECHGYGVLDPRNPHPFFRSGPAGDWRRHLSAAQVREIVGTHGRRPASQRGDSSTRGGAWTTVGALTKALCQEFEVDEEVCLRDVGILLDEMAAADLVELVSQDSDAAGTAG